MSMKIPLTKMQREIMKEFYSKKRTKVVFDKSQRNALWKSATSREKIREFDSLELKCPALAHQINKSIESGKNIQSAVFSECVYAQTFANMLNLDCFENCFDNNNCIPEQVKNLLSSYHLSPRYVYSNHEKSRILIQAGGCDGIDSALITVFDLSIYTIEFKEPGAKTSEPDLPKYDEDGVLKVTNEFIEKYPQFKEMLNEQKGLNFFEAMGQNINNFSKDSINIAVSNNYTKKYADVICTEDADGYLVMMPANQVPQWAEIYGEIRPAGRNHYKVWTPNALKRLLKEKKAVFNGDAVAVSKSVLVPRIERGGHKKISGYKICPIFFVYMNCCDDNGDYITFNIENVLQLNPTIAGKMFFRSLKYLEVKEYYKL